MLKPLILYIHTHTHTGDLLNDKKIENKKVNKIQNRENIKINNRFGNIKSFLYKIKTGSKGYRKTTKRRKGEPLVVDLNLSLTVIKTMLIFAIISIIMAQLTLTILKAQREKKSLATQEEKPNVEYVASKKIDENREEILDENKEPIDDTRTVPVPAGYTASQVPGERSIDTGFVIYEGDINWADYINKDDIYNKDPNIGVEKPVKINISEETSISRWELLDNGVYTSGYVDETGTKYGNYNKDNVENKLISKELILKQSETLIIKWAVSSEIEDKLYYTIKNTETGEIIGGEKTAISGTDAGTNIDELIYTDAEVKLEIGTYEIEFVYVKNDSNSEGLDAGFVKSIEKKPQDYEVPELVFNIPEGDGATENNHHWLQYEDGTYVSGYVDETGKTYGNYHVPNSTNILTSEEFTLEKEALLKFDWAISAESDDYGYTDNIYYSITDKETGSEIAADRMGQIWFGYDDYANFDFASRSEKINPGTYIVSFEYTKNNSIDEGLDAGFVRNVRLEANKDSHIDIDFNKRIYRGGEYEENVYATGYIKEDRPYGNYHIDNSISKLQTEEITILEKGVVLKFDWSVSSERNYQSGAEDCFYYKITNTKTNEVIEGESEKIYGTQRGTNYRGLKFEEKALTLEPGTYIIEYIYEKDDSGHEGLDSGFIKNIRTVKTFTLTEINVFNLQKSINQYVWVPINEYELEEIYGVDRNGKLWGKLYKNDYNTTITHSKSGLNWEILEDGTMNIIDATKNREPDVTRALENKGYGDDKWYRYDLDSQLPKELVGETRYELLSKELEQDFHKTIESIKKYGGFYIGRYETGDSGVVQKMSGRDGNHGKWYSLYKKCNVLKGENTNVRTSMIWGSLWDATLRWFIASGETASNGVKIDNTYLTDYNYAKFLGNYNESEFDYISADATVPLYDSKKLSDKGGYIMTGATEHTNINNIYDMAGLSSEYTLESSGTESRVHRGHYLNVYYSVNSYPSYRNERQYGPSDNQESDICVRAVLYIE